MLVLKRKTTQTIRIGDVTVTVLAGGPVKLGIDAPLDVLIVRGELEESCFDATAATTPRNSETSLPLHTTQRTG